MPETPNEGVVHVVDDLIRRAIAARASDLHFEPLDTGLQTRLRIDGLLHDGDLLPAVIAPNVVARLKVLAGLLTYRTDVPQEGSVSRQTGAFGCDIRVATFPTVRGERAVLRLMGSERRPLTLAELGHDPELIERFARVLDQPQGLVVVCGPAGSGKSTTLYAALEHLRCKRPGVSILALEDPVEVRLEGVTQVQVEPTRQLTYPVALRSLLRQDPQILMVGEVRDAQTAGIVIEAALTGHLLLTTLHSGSPAAAIIRLRELGVPSYQLTSTLHAVLAQRLLRTPVCGVSRRADRRGLRDLWRHGLRGAHGDWRVVGPGRDLAATHHRRGGCGCTLRVRWRRPIGRRRGPACEGGPDDGGGSRSGSRGRFRVKMLRN